MKRILTFILLGLICTSCGKSSQKRSPAFPVPSAPEVETPVEDDGGEVIIDEPSEEEPDEEEEPSEEPEEDGGQEEDDISPHQQKLNALTQELLELELLQQERPLTKQEEKRMEVIRMQLLKLLSKIN